MLLACMSYFMTIAGAVTAGDVPTNATLVPVKDAQAYVARLESELAQLDGTPVFLVDDGESGTSHGFVTEVGEALFQDLPLREVPFVILLESCFRHRWSFRVWLADDDPQAH